MIKLSKKEKPWGKTHLIIPDGHTQPGVSNERYTWLGRLIADLRPDVIVNLGDHWDLKSLCSYDKGKRGYESRRYNEDVEAGREAMVKMLKPLKRVQKQQGRNRKKVYRPRMVFCIGNHEQRIERALDAEPILQGTIGYKDLHLEDFGWEVYNYLTLVPADGIMYCHAVQNTNSPSVASGVHLTHNLLQKYHCSVTVGHCHLLDFKTTIRGDKQRIMAVAPGCFFAHYEEWAGRSNDAYWRGIMIKRNVVDGVYDLETMTIDRLKRTYS